MKKLCSIILLVTLLLIPAACSTSSPSMTALDVYTKLKDAGLPVGGYIEYTEDTDPNNLMNKNGQYIEKLSFEITTLEQLVEDSFTGGSIEVFTKKSDAESRKEYIEALGIFGVESSYIINDTILLRIDREITATDAQKYADVFK